MVRRSIKLDHNYNTQSTNINTKWQMKLNRGKWKDDFTLRSAEKMIRNWPSRTTRNCSKTLSCMAFPYSNTGCPELKRYSLGKSTNRSSSMIPLSYFILHNLGSTSTVVSATQWSFISSTTLKLPNVPPQLRSLWFAYNCSSITFPHWQASQNLSVLIHA